MKEKPRKKPKNNTSQDIQNKKHPKKAPNILEPKVKNNYNKKNFGLLCEVKIKKLLKREMEKAHPKLHREHTKEL